MLTSVGSREPDFRWERRLLPPEVFAWPISTTSYPPPRDLVDRETWEGLIGLEDHVTLYTSDHHGKTLAELYELECIWVSNIGEWESRDLLFEPMLDASEEYHAATYLALSGHYRQAIGCLRNALESVVIGAGCAVRSDEASYQLWRSGQQEMSFARGADYLMAVPLELTLQRACKDSLFGQKKQATQRTPAISAGFVRRFYSELSDYAHSRPGSTNGDLWQSNGPIYVSTAFRLTTALCVETYALCYAAVALARRTFILPDRLQALLRPAVDLAGPPLPEAYAELFPTAAIVS
jgi:hypothetical protein